MIRADAQESPKDEFMTIRESSGSGIGKVLTKLRSSA